MHALKPMSKAKVHTWFVTQSAQDCGVIISEAPGDTSEIMCDATPSCLHRKSS